MFRRAKSAVRANRFSGRRQGRYCIESLEPRQVLSVSISGTVWLDTNSDGIRTASESTPTVFSNVYAYPATLAGGPAAVATITGGQYTMPNLPAGDYIITLGTLNEESVYRYSPINRTPDESLDNDVSPNTSFSSVVTLTDGQSSPNVDIGIWRPGQIEGTVDFKGLINGEQASLSLGGIKFTLVEASGAEFAEFTTDERGEFKFGDVPEGDYYVEVNPLGSATIASSSGDFSFNAQTLRTATFHLTGGEQLETKVTLTTDAPFTIGGRLWHDLNANGVQDVNEPGIAGRDVGIVSYAQGGYYGYGVITTTDAEGNYRFNGLPPARFQLGVQNFSYSPYVINTEAFSAPQQSNVDTAFDSDFQPTSGVTPEFVVATGADLLNFDGGLFYRGRIEGSVFDDLNGDGLRVSSEQAMASAEVRLLREDGTLVSSTRTDPNGAYRFADLLPRTYIVEIVRPDGTALTAGGNAQSGRTDPFAVNSNEIVARHFGIHGTSAATGVTGLVWNDANGNGVHDAGELPMAEVSVSLLTTSGTNVASATTNAAGQYVFMGIAPGGYMMRFMTASGTFSPMNRGNDLSDSDVNRGSGLTAPFPVFTGQIETSQDVGVYTGHLSTDVVANLRVTEVGFVGHDNSEFVEVRNIGTQPIDLTAVQFTDGIRYNFSDGLTSLFPGEYGVIVGDYALLSSRVDVTQINVMGLYSGDINREERMTLVDAEGQTVLSFRYDDDWFILMDREVMPWTLSVIDETVAPELWTQRSTWRPSSVLAGSPGMPDPATTPDPGAILINEVLTKSDDGFNDLIELRNTTDADIDIGGWYLGDSNSVVSPLIYLTRYRIPSDTIVPANGYLVLSRENDFGVFGLSSFGETLHLVAGDEYGAMAGYAESVTFGGTEVGVSFGRYENAAGIVDMLPQQTTTFGGENSLPRIGPVVFSEIMYHSTDGVDYVELVNTSTAPVDLGSPGFEWRLDGNIQFTFAQNTILPAGGRAVVANISPTQFRLQHNLGLDVIVAGPYAGDLDNGGGSIEVGRYDDEIKRENGRYNRKEYIYDRVTFDDTAPWPLEADGAGSSLERISLNVYGNHAPNWMASETAGGTPGRANTTPFPGDCDGDGSITPADIDTMTLMTNAGTYDSHYDFDGSGTLDSGDRTFLITTLLGVSFGDSNFDGQTGLADVMTVRRNLGTTGGWAQGDFTGDGMVTLADLATVVSNLGSATAAWASAPGSVVVAATNNAATPREGAPAAARTETPRAERARAGTDAPADTTQIPSDRSAARRSARPISSDAVDAALDQSARDMVDTARARRTARLLRR
jgi:protocatechuate 3,4-dioxygenase beta subunit